MNKETLTSRTCSSLSANTPNGKVEIFECIKEIRRQRNRSWLNIRKAARALQGKNHEPFGTPKVESVSKSDVRKICSETNLTFSQLEALLDEHGLGLEHE